MKKILLTTIVLLGSLVTNAQICTNQITSVVFSPVNNSNDLQVAINSGCCELHNLDNFTLTSNGSDQTLNLCYIDTGLLMPSNITTTITLPGLNTIGNQNFIINSNIYFFGGTCSSGQTFNPPISLNLDTPITQPRTFQLSVAEYDLKKIILFPNPNSGNFTLQLPSDDAQAQLTVTDLSGKKIFSVESYFSGDEIQLKGLSKGIYFAKILCNQTTDRKSVV